MLISRTPRRSRRRMSASRSSSRSSEVLSSASLLRASSSPRIASTNPRTSQRALLVASELARLIPDAVLHNVMPIFTFMGASDFQRDDAYSFGVVEKVSLTIER